MKKKTTIPLQDGKNWRIW